MHQRVARLFAKRVVLGTVVGWMPACKLESLPATFRVVHDDGDGARGWPSRPWPLARARGHAAARAPHVHMYGLSQARCMQRNSRACLCLPVLACAEEDLEETDTLEAASDYTRLAPRESRWLRLGHELLHQRVLRVFDGVEVVGTITRWLPEEVAAAEPALFRCEHADGDREELEEDEVLQGLSAFRERVNASEGAAPAAPSTSSASNGEHPPAAAALGVPADAPELWCASGHAFIGRRIVRTFDKGVTAVATITKWLPSSADDAMDNPALFRAVHGMHQREHRQRLAPMHSRDHHPRLPPAVLKHAACARLSPPPDDGDEEDLEECEVDEGLRAFDEKALEGEWRDHGHAYVGKRVLRSFGAGTGSAKRARRQSLGTIVRWLPAGAEADEPELFRAVHDDGDEEDLEGFEAEEAIQAFEAIPPRRSSGRFA